MIAGIAAAVKKAMKCKTIAGNFDSMFELTYALKANNGWMHDNEMWFVFSFLIAIFYLLIIL